MAQDKTKQLSEEELKATTGGSIGGNGSSGSGQGGFGHQPGNWMFGNVFESGNGMNSGEGNIESTGSASGDTSVGEQSM